MLIEAVAENDLKQMAVRNDRSLMGSDAKQRPRRSKSSRMTSLAHSGVEAGATSRVCGIARENETPASLVRLLRPTSPILGMRSRRAS